MLHYIFITLLVISCVLCCISLIKEEEKLRKISILLIFLFIILDKININGMDWFYSKSKEFSFFFFVIIPFAAFLFICQVIGYFLEYKKLFIMSYILDKIWKDKE